MSTDENQSETNVITATLSDQFQQKIADEFARNIEKYAPMDSYTISINGVDVIFNRRKILTKERKELEALRSKLASQARRGLESSVETEDKLWKKTAEFFLIDSNTNQRMTAEQFEGCVFEDIKKILDACSYRTERTIPPLGN